MSGKRVLAVYAALLLGFAVVLCRLYLLALHPAYAARAAAQSTVTLQLPARRGNFYDAQGRLLTPGCVEGTEEPIISHRTNKEGEEPQPSLPADSAS